MTNCVDLNLQVNPLREDIQINSYGTTKHIRISLDDINHDLISLLTNLNLSISWAELFYTPPFSFTGIHIDDVYHGDYTKINFVFGGKNSLMYWWKQKPDVLNTPSTTIINSPYIGYTLNEVDLIDKQQVKFPSIVQVGVPHNIHNFEEPRYCLSLVLRKQDNTRLTMAESVEIFKQYL